MNSLLRRALGVAALCLLAGSLSMAQDWQKAESLPDVNLDGLSAAQKATALKILREYGCTCGCDMKVAQCRVQDPSCSYSNSISAVVVDAIRSGKNEQQAIELAKASKYGRPHEVKLLEDPVTIPVVGSPAIGPAISKITIVEFSDFQCPYCIAAVPEIDAVLKAYPKDAKLIFKQFPLEIHSQAYLAATAALAAHKQGKFWPMHYAMFEHHNELTSENILKLAKELGLDMDRFQKDMASKELHDAVAKDVHDGDTAGVEGTPTIFINGQRYNGPIALASLKPILDAASGVKPKVQASR